MQDNQLEKQPSVLEQPDICEINSECERNAIWNMIFYQRWGFFPTNKLQQLFEGFAQEPTFQENLSIMLQKLKNSIDDKLLQSITIEQILKVNKGTHLKSKLNILLVGIAKNINYLIAREVIKVLIGGINKNGKSKAIIAIETIALKLAAKSGPIAFKVFGSPGVGLASKVVEYVVNKIATQFEIQDKRLLSPQGLIFVVPQLFQQFVNDPIGLHPESGQNTIFEITRQHYTIRENWVFYETKGISNICFGSYPEHDQIYWHTYDRKYPKSESVGDYLSAGQPQNESFQISIWCHDHKLCHIKEVYYRDLLRVTQIEDEILILHCKGGLNPSAGSVEIVYRNTFLAD